MQRGAGVRAVERLAAQLRLRVDGAARADERRDVGDRVAHPVAAVAPLEVHGLVEVHRARRVDGEERQVGDVVRAKRRAAAAAACGLGLHVGGKLSGSSQLGPDLGEPGAQLGAVGGRAGAGVGEAPGEPTQDRP